MEGCDWADGNLGVEAGLIPRCIDHIFTCLKAFDSESYAVKVSFMEIYNEELTDLLFPGKVRLRDVCAVLYAVTMTGGS